MLMRRAAIAAALPAALARPAHAAGGFESFVAGVYAEAAASGIRRDVLDAAFAGVAPNQKVIERTAARSSSPSPGRSTGRG